MTWTLIRNEFRGVDCVIIRDKAGFIGHIYYSRISPGVVKDMLEVNVPVEVELVPMIKEKKDDPEPKS